MPRILIIDDDNSITESLSMYLSEENYEVEIANRGRLGLKQYIGGSFDLVILDIRLPDIDGFTVLQELKKSDNGAKIIMITAYHDEANQQRAFAEGACHYVKKPIDINILEDAVKKSPKGSMCLLRFQS